jgi:adenylate cyclase
VGARVANSRRVHTRMLALVAIISAGVAVIAYATNVLKPQDSSTVDARFAIRGKERPPRNIVLVAIEAKTVGDLNVLNIPRRVDAKVIDRIAADHPAAITFDVQLSEASPGSSQAQERDEGPLLTAIMNARGRTVFSETETDGHGSVRFLGAREGTKLLHAVGSRPGNGLFPFDSGGVIRRMSYSIDGLDTLAVVTARVATGRGIDRAQFGGATNWIDYIGPAGTFPSVSFSDVRAGRFRPGYFRGKIVVIGATAPTLLDIHATSTDGQMSGPEIQANAIDTVLRGMPLSSVPGWLNIALIVLLAAAVPLVSLRFGPVVATALALGLGAAFTVSVQLAFNAGAIVSFIYPLGGLILSGAGSLATQLASEAFERVRVRDMFSRFVPENVVDEVLASADGLRLGGVQRDGTVMFTDLRGFTSLAESLTPARVIQVLNRYLSEMSDAILDHGGTLVAYMGDGIMAVFGAPLPLADHADRALATAREMLAVRLPRFNEWLRAEGLGERFRMGIGLNSGQVMSGHVGSERRVEYTAVGDTTNIASRIEELTKGTAHQLLLSAATKEALLSVPTDLIEVGETVIRGRVGRMKLWSVAEEHQIEPNAQRERLRAPSATPTRPLTAPGE